MNSNLASIETLRTPKTSDADHYSYALSVSPKLSKDELKFFTTLSNNDNKI
tara:strand:+ start:199 stop:351 length:153 start_codon:yes stop_codon:yes gene_type:complete